MFVNSLSPLGRNLDFGQRGNGVVHGGEVHVHDLIALAAVGLLDGVLQQRDGLLEGDHLGELEERGRMIMLMRPPRPISMATFTASTL